jgi:Domain of unknown function (DUF397)
MNDSTWRKSSYSSAQGNCVEVCTSQPGVVAVRDSKDRYGHEITVSDQAWSALVQRIKQGEFGLR